MSSFPILDLVLGMMFIYFLLSIICSSAVEMVLTIRRLRARMLYEWLYKIFDQPVTTGNKTVPLGQAIMDHCSITALSKEGTSTSYIDAKNFTGALLEKVTYDPANPLSIATDLNTLIQSIQATPILSIELKRTFLGYAYDARDTYQLISNKTVSDVELFKNKIERWFDSSMERVGGTLKSRYTRYWTFTIALIAALLLNSDSITLARYLYNNKDARENLSSQAYREVQDSSWLKTLNNMEQQRPGDSATLEEIKANLRKRVKNIKDVNATLNDALPLGWNSYIFNDEKGFSFWLLLSKIVGISATVLAVMMGAPFWFDMMNKVSNLRGTGNKPATTADDTQQPAKPAPTPVSITVNTKPDEEAIG